jgi:pimeloyl-ACP methyl ester carboxylesterase
VATFVLIHGAMHGGWCWRPVEALLREAGHEAHAPTLTGMGDRAHLLSPDIGVDTHVADVVATLHMEDVHDAVLVLHSYAGVLAGPVAQAAGDRVGRVVAMGAFLADPGEGLADVEPPEVVDRYRQLAADEGQGWRVPASPAFMEQWSVPEALRARVGPRLTDFPARCVADRVAYDRAVLEALPRDYVEHTAPPLASLAGTVERARERGWRMHEIATGHDLMLQDPSGTARLLMEIAS